MPSRIVATCFALACFAGAIVAGLAAANSATTILFRGIIVLLVAWPIGLAIGAACEKTIGRSIDSFKQANPVPTDEAAFAEAARRMRSEAGESDSAEAEAGAGGEAADARAAPDAEADARVAQAVGGTAASSGSRVRGADGSRGQPPPRQEAA